MQQDEWMGHPTARRKLTENGWMYEDTEMQSFAGMGCVIGFSLPVIDAFIEKLEAEGVGAGAELRERRGSAFAGRHEVPVLQRHMEWIISRRKEILLEEARPTTAQIKAIERTHNARLGGKARANAYTPITEFAQELARKKAPPSGRWQSKRQAFLAIKEDVLAFSRTKGKSLSPNQAEKTIVRWLKLMPDADNLFDSKQGTSTSKRTTSTS